MSDEQTYFMYVGTYASETESGIYVYRFDPGSGKLTAVQSVSGIANPSFLAIERQKLRLYAVGETETFQGHKGGSVTAFALQPGTGELTRLNQQPTEGGAPCYVSIDRTGNCLLIANYAGGSISLFPLGENGEIGEIATHIQHHGHGSNPARQEGPHPHSIRVDPDGRYVFVPDLGLDTLFAYRLDPSAHTLTLHEETRVTAGAGPRHLDFHPSGDYLYLINELNSTITAFAYAAEPGTLRQVQTVSTLPADFVGENTCADIHISGTYLYGSNRGDDSIAVFQIQPDSGQLSFVQRVSTLGKTPRNFGIAPGGKYLFAANQDSNTIITYAIDPASGRLTPTGDVLELPRPVCVQFLSL